MHVTISLSNDKAADCGQMTIRQQRGFTLIEVLVAALVLAIGLIGVAGLQAVSLRANQSALMRSQATALAYDLADRMRANVPAASIGSYDPATASVTTGCTSNSGCAPTSLAQNDLSEWSDLIADHLPAGEGFVCIDSTPDDGTGFGDPQCDGNGSEFAIKLWWDEDRDGATTVTAVNNERLVISLRL
jgi:type IV pilus assembly protein PilV